MAELETVVAEATVKASQFDLDTAAMSEHLQDIRNQLTS